MDNPQTLATLGTRHRTKTNKPSNDNTIHKGTLISNMDLTKHRSEYMCSGWVNTSCLV